jgi:hypothetical protein
VIQWTYITSLNHQLSSKGSSPFPERQMKAEVISSLARVAYHVPRPCENRSTLKLGCGGGNGDPPSLYELDYLGLLSWQPLAPSFALSITIRPGRRSTTIATFSIVYIRFLRDYPDSRGFQDIFPPERLPQQHHSQTSLDLGYWR